MEPAGERWKVAHRIFSACRADLSVNTAATFLSRTNCLQAIAIEVVAKQIENCFQLAIVIPELTFIQRAKQLVAIAEDRFG